MRGATYRKYVGAENGNWIRLAIAVTIASATTPLWLPACQAAAKPGRAIVAATRAVRIGTRLRTDCQTMRCGKLLVEARRRTSPSRTAASAANHAHFRSPESGRGRSRTASGKAASTQ